jgi:hypothetical protein
MTLVPIQTYNLTIEGNHTYYANGILVHNKLATPPSTTSGGGGGGQFGGTEISNYNGTTFGDGPTRPTRNTSAYLTNNQGE